MSKAVQSLLIVAGFAVATALLLDVLIGRIVPGIPHEYETLEAIEDYKSGDPQVLILGSSYARSFIQLADWYRRQSPATEIAVVPIEGGKFFAYEWLLDHRLRPLVDEIDSSGARVRGKLQELVLVVNYWDICSLTSHYANLPARAWALGDYLRDFAAHGATPYNSNYIDQHWSEWTHWSILASDRGFFRIVPRLRQRVGAGQEQALERGQEMRLAGWLTMVADNDMAAPGCRVQEQEAALDRILDFARQRKLAVTMVLWTMIPKAQTPEVLAVTERFKQYLLRRTAGRDIVVADLQSDAVLADSDFRPDLDHLLPAGDEKVLQWALAGPLRNLNLPQAPNGGSSSQAAR